MNVTTQKSRNNQKSRRKGDAFKKRFLSNLDKSYGSNTEKSSFWHSLTPASVKNLFHYHKHQITLAKAELDAEAIECQKIEHGFTSKEMDKSGILTQHRVEVNKEFHNPVIPRKDGTKVTIPLYHEAFNTSYKIKEHDDNLQKIDTTISTCIFKSTNSSERWSSAFYNYAPSLTKIVDSLDRRIHNDTALLLSNPRIDEAKLENNKSRFPKKFDPAIGYIPVPIVFSLKVPEKKKLLQKIVKNVAVAECFSENYIPKDTTTITLNPKEVENLSKKILEKEEVIEKKAKDLENELLEKKKEYERIMEEEKNMELQREQLKMKRRKKKIVEKDEFGMEVKEEVNEEKEVETVISDLNHSDVDYISKDPEDEDEIDPNAITEESLIAKFNFTPTQENSIAEEDMFYISNRDALDKAIDSPEDEGGSFQETKFYLGDVVYLNALPDGGVLERSQQPYKSDYHTVYSVKNGNFPYIPRRILAEASVMNTHHNLVQSVLSQHRRDVAENYFDIHFNEVKLNEHKIAEISGMNSISEVCDYQGLIQRPLLTNHVWKNSPCNIKDKKRTIPTVALDDIKDRKLDKHTVEVLTLENAINACSPYTKSLNVPIPSPLAPLEGVILEITEETVVVEFEMPYHLAFQWFDQSYMTNNLLDQNDKLMNNHRKFISKYDQKEKIDYNAILNDNRPCITDLDHELTLIEEKMVEQVVGLEGRRYESDKYALEQIQANYLREIITATKHHILTQTRYPITQPMFTYKFPKLDNNNINPKDNPIINEERSLPITWMISKGPNTLEYGRVKSAVAKFTSPTYYGNPQIKHVVGRMANLNAFDPICKDRIFKRVLKLDDQLIYTGTNSEDDENDIDVIGNNEKYKLIFQPKTKHQDSYTKRLLLFRLFSSNHQIISQITPLLRKHEVGVFAHVTQFSSPISLLSISHARNLVDLCLLKTLRKMEGISGNAMSVVNQEDCMVKQVDVRKKINEKCLSENRLNLSLEKEVVPSTVGRFYFHRNPVPATRPTKYPNTNACRYLFQHQVLTSAEDVISQKTIRTNYHEDLKEKLPFTSVNEVVDVHSDNLTTSITEAHNKFRSRYSETPDFDFSLDNIPFPSLEETVLHPQGNHNPLPYNELVLANEILNNTGHLNASQHAAVMKVFNQSVTLLQGPPGTGKTSTIVMIVWLWTMALGNTLVGESKYDYPTPQDFIKSASQMDQKTCINKMTLESRFEHEDLSPFLLDTEEYHDIDEFKVLTKNRVKEITDNIYHPDQGYNEKYDRLYPGISTSNFTPSRNPDKIYGNLQPLHVTSRGPVLVSAYTNIAIDVICKRLLEKPGFSLDDDPTINPESTRQHKMVIRFGHPDTMMEEVKEASLIRRMERDHEYIKAVKNLDTQTEELKKKINLLEQLRNQIFILTAMKMEIGYITTNSNIVNLARQADFNVSTITSVGALQKTLEMKTNSINSDIYQYDSKLRRIKHKICQRLLKEADVICATCISAGNHQLQDLNFSLVIIDECTQVPEKATIIPLSKIADSYPGDFVSHETNLISLGNFWNSEKRNNSDIINYGLIPAVRTNSSYSRIVLVGDQCQLPPSVRQERLKLASVNVSLFERLLLDHDMPVYTLTNTNVHNKSSNMNTIQNSNNKYNLFFPNLISNYTNANPQLADNISYSPLLCLIPSTLRVQYRMHPIIPAWVSNCIYNRVLKSGVHASHRPSVAGFPWPIGDIDEKSLVYKTVNAIKKQKMILSFGNIYQQFKFYDFAVKINVSNLFPLQVFSKKDQDNFKFKTIQKNIASLNLTQKLPHLHTQLQTLPLIFINVDYPEDKNISVSKSNSMEADVVSHLCASLLNVLPKPTTYFEKKSEDFFINNPNDPLVHKCTMNSSNVPSSHYSYTTPQSIETKPISWCDDESDNEEMDPSQIATHYMKSATVHNTTQYQYVRSDEIGIITGYTGQVRTIRDRLNNLSYFLDANYHLVKPMNRTARNPDDLNEVEVKAVDGFQGREKDVIIFSCVRSNPNGALGFLTDIRRLNVAITRAKKNLIIVGNRSTLESNDTWRSYLQFIEQNGGYIEGDAIYPYLANTYELPSVL